MRGSSLLMAGMSSAIMIDVRLAFARLEAGPAVRRGLLHRQARGRGQARAHELCVQHGARGAQEQRVLREHLEHMPRGHKLKREGERDDEAEQALDQDAPHPLNVERDNALGVVPVQPIPQGAEGEEHHGEHGLAAVEHLLEPVRLLHRVLDGQHRGDAFDGEDGDAEEDGEGLPPRPGVDLAEDAHGAVLVADGGEGEAVGHDEQHRRDHGYLQRRDGHAWGSGARSGGPHTVHLFFGLHLFQATAMESKAFIRDGRKLRIWRRASERASERGRGRGRGRENVFYKK
mmetsp:Transcript_4857/g.15106  ORF Transcript_4857/g.15106 Transcript_4857/m.15106 type:complete len:288 (+) Transcript_4857:1689-2552(+)